MINEDFDNPHTKTVLIRSNNKSSTIFLNRETKKKMICVLVKIS